eukprot:1156418-Heterocapsa_arctica.AAC.1
MEKAMTEGDGRLRQGAFEEAVRWYSKGIWLVISKKITDSPSDSYSILAYIGLEKWAEAEADGSAALSNNQKNAKAGRCRAIARYEALSKH